LKVFQNEQANESDIREALLEADVGLVVISSKGWERASFFRLVGKSRQPEDLVRTEVVTLLRRTFPSGQPIPVIPVVIGTDLPGPEDLPKDMRALAKLPAWRLTSVFDVGFELSVNQLIEHIRLKLVESRIREAVETRVKELKLSVLGLTRLPESLGKLTLLERLDVSHNQLTALPDSLGLLTQLERLDVSHNQLTWLPDSLHHLQLKSLDVSHNRLASFPDSICVLPRLQSLDIRQTGLKALPESVGQLTHLRNLDISENHLEALPESVGQLTRLLMMDASQNELTALPESLGQLTQLLSLDVSQNKLTALPNWLGQFSQLQSLDISQNELTAFPESIGHLTKLRTINVQKNQLTTLPESLKQLSGLKALFLHGNKALGIPPEVLGAPPNDARFGESLTQPASILDYYFRIRRGLRRLNEAKLILVGRGGVGKTCLIKRLIYDTFDEHESETPGINIELMDINLPDGDEVRLHVWDFGGQRILHGTHQFFLTERTLYLLVLSGREDSATQDAEYWLQLIKSFGSESRVIVALNKTHQHPFDVNRGLLLEKYPFIAEFVKTDCKEPTVGLERLQQMVDEQADALEHRKTAFPLDWFAIKERLATMPESFISWDDYQKICRELGEMDPQAQRDLAKYLHILGIALNYADDPRLQDTRVLKPTWVTEGLYTLLRAGHKQNSGGVLRPGDLARALDAKLYPQSKHDFLLRLMERFQLCFRLPGQEERYLVPELLDENQPDLSALLASPGLGFRYQYEVLPEGLLPRFIVQTHIHSEGNPLFRWRTGVVLERDGCRAIVRADVRERRVDIHILGIEPLRRALLAIIREKFDEQHRDLKGLRVDERVPVPGQKDATGNDITVSYRHLLELEEDGIDSMRPEGVRFDVSVSELLTGVEDDVRNRKRNLQEMVRRDEFLARPSRSERENMPNSKRSAPPIFVSYAHDDNKSPDSAKRWLNRLREHLEPLVQQGQIVVCSDQDTYLSDDWHGHIQQYLDGAKAAVLLVSPAFLASEYIRSSELPVLLRKAKEEGVMIIPIVLRPCLFAESKFKYPDPDTGPEEFTLASLQAAGSSDQALSEMSEAEQDRALLNVARTLATLANT